MSPPGRTISVELLAPSVVKQQAFLRLQKEAGRLQDQWAEAIGNLAVASRELSDPAISFALASLKSAEQSVRALPEPWRFTLERLIHDQAWQLRRLRQVAKSGVPRRDQANRRRPTLPPVEFGADSWSLTCIDGNWKLVIPLLGRTVALPIAIPSGQDGALRGLLTHGIPMEGHLFRRRGRWFFSARYLNRAPKPRKGAPAVGVDLGHAMRAVAYELGSGQRMLLSGKAARAKEVKYRRLIRQLRSAGARQAARRLEGKLARYQLQSDRETAGAIVAFARKFDRPVIKLEAPTSPKDGLEAQARKPQGRQEPRFGRITRMVARRAEPDGIAVVAVDGRSSSIRCSSCGQSNPSWRNGTRFFCRECCYGAHADLNAARNLAQTVVWQETLQITPAEYDLDRKAVGTAVPSVGDVRDKDGVVNRGSLLQRTLIGAFAGGMHAVSSYLAVLASKVPSKEELTMASIVKDLNESTSKFVVGTLDNVKSYVDKTSEELSKVDVVGVTRHILDTALDGAKNVVKTSAEPSGLDTFGMLKAVADGSLEATRDVVSVVAEEGKKADVLGMSTRIALEGLSALRNEVDLTLETGKTLFNRLAPLATTAKPVTTRPPQVTRVEIEHEKPSKGSTKTAS